MRRIPLALFGVLLLLIGSALWASTWLRPGRTEQVYTVSDTDTGVQTEIFVSQPAWIRYGMSEPVQLSLRQVEPNGGTWVVAPEVHAGGTVLKPAAQQGGALGPVDRATYRWTLTPLTRDPVRLEISLRVATDPSMNPSLVWAETYRLHVRDILGMPVGIARAASALVAAVGATWWLIASKAWAR